MTCVTFHKTADPSVLGLSLYSECRHGCHVLGALILICLRLGQITFQRSCLVNEVTWVNPGKNALVVFVVLPHWGRGGLCSQGAGRAGGAAELGGLVRLSGAACDKITRFSCAAAAPAGRSSCWDAHRCVLQTVLCSTRYKRYCFLTSLTYSRPLHGQSFSPHQNHSL